MSQNIPTYHIVGGGIAGLSCAWFIKEKLKKSKVVVYEAAPILGGRAFSYYDKTLDCTIDNATHAIIGANKFLSKFVKKNEWQQTKYFVDPYEFELNESLLKNKEIILKSICNTKAETISKSIIKNISKQLFPYVKSKTKLWFSTQNLSPRIINLLSAKADIIHLNCRLKKIHSQFGMAAVLDFGDKQTDIGKDDKVIIALDNKAASEILNIKPLEHNQIINIIYRTSQKIFLPKGASFIGLRSCIADWLFVNEGFLTATISDYRPSQGALSDLGINIWREIDKIRGVNSGFVPPHKIFCYSKATVKQDETNNNQRPDSAKTEYPNVFIAGDWTMKNYPCCMETAVQSAKRAVKEILKI